MKPNQPDCNEEDEVWSTHNKTAAVQLHSLFVLKSAVTPRTRPSAVVLIKILDGTYLDIKSSKNLKGYLHLRAVILHVTCKAFCHSYVVIVKEKNCWLFCVSYFAKNYIFISSSLLLSWTHATAAQIFWRGQQNGSVRMHGVSGLFVPATKRFAHLVRTDADWNFKKFFQKCSHSKPTHQFL